MQRGASMTTDKHVDPAAAVPVGDEVEDSNLKDVPEGTVRFELDRSDIEEALAAPSMQVRHLFRAMISRSTEDDKGQQLERCA